MAVPANKAGRLPEFTANKLGLLTGLFANVTALNDNCPQTELSDRIICQQFFLA
jgi:hypothetical protein